ncbi:hypothetical protein ACRHK7_00370 [Weissella tructae]|uniref:hypothetical protein n=1 Tax=Weissella tructae TaxID=887702 RepID=UPI003D8CF54E
MKLKIGSLEYEIVYEHNPQSEEAEPLWGDVNHNRGVIRIQENMIENMQGITVIHEALHGIMFERGMTNYQNDEELIVPLASGLVAFLKDNPDVLVLLGIGGDR